MDSIRHVFKKKIRQQQPLMQLLDSTELSKNWKIKFEFGFKCCFQSKGLPNSWVFISDLHLRGIYKFLSQMPEATLVAAFLKGQKLILDTSKCKMWV